MPTNYNTTTRTYTGIWDGTFKNEYTNNPAWILYDFVMNDTFGLNAYFPIIMDKWDCYEAAQWCDGMVPDGKGGTTVAGGYYDVDGKPIMDPAAASPTELCGRAPRRLARRCPERTRPG